MSATVKIKNETHWQSRDIGKFVRACLKHAGFKLGDVFVTVDYPKPGNSYGEIGLVIQNTQRRVAGFHAEIDVLLNLPKRGPRGNALTMLATTAVSDDPVLPPEVVYELARTLALTLISRTKLELCRTPKMRTRKRELESNRGSRVRPSWLPPETYIKRYAKPKAPAKKTFMEKVEDALERAEARVEEWEAELEHAESHLKRARRDLKNEQKRLRDARKRAKERGEAVEFIGPTHRLYGRF